MGLQLSAFPSLPQSTQTVTLEGTQFRARFTWRHRCQAWYLDLYSLDGTAIALGRRLSPGWGPVFGLSVVEGPEGLLLVHGTDGYAREDLGAGLHVRYFTRDELRAAQAAEEDDGVVIEV